MTLKPLEEPQIKAIKNALQRSSIMIQLLYLAFPLTVFMVYQKIIVNQSFYMLLIVFGLLVINVFLQFFFKKQNVILTNTLKYYQILKDKIRFIKKTVTTEKKVEPSLAIEHFKNKERNNVEKIQQLISKSSRIPIYLYFIFILIIGKLLVIIPAITFSINYFLTLKISKEYIKSRDLYEKYNRKKQEKIRDIIINIKLIKMMSIEKWQKKQLESTIKKANQYQTASLYLTNKANRIWMFMNIITIASLSIVGKFLHTMGLVSMENVITCSLLTMWVSRPLNQILSTLLLIKNKRKNNNIKTKEIAKINLENKSNLFYASILDNIALFNKEKYEKAIEYCKKLDIESTIENIPYGYNYVILGNNDEIIPDELKKMICILREMLSNPESNSLKTHKQSFHRKTQEKIEALLSDEKPRNN
jgi:ABC-type bacteriocin/lantibiotic exporter with double-glycine peptidase domain